MAAKATAEGIVEKASIGNLYKETQASFRQSYEKKNFSPYGDQQSKHPTLHHEK